MNVVRSSAVYQLLESSSSKQAEASMTSPLGTRLAGRRSATSTLTEPAQVDVGAREPGGSVLDYVRVVGGPALARTRSSGTTGRPGARPRSCSAASVAVSPSATASGPGDHARMAVHDRALVRVGVLAHPVVLAGGAPVAVASASTSRPATKRSAASARSVAAVMPSGAAGPRPSAARVLRAAETALKPRTATAPRVETDDTVARTAVSTRWQGRAAGHPRRF